VSNICEFVYFLVFDLNYQKFDEFSLARRMLGQSNDVTLQHTINLKNIKTSPTICSYI